MSHFIPTLDIKSPEFAQAQYILLSKNCPHCECFSTLRSHGFLRNVKGDVRAFRVFCSNRGDNTGCGKTYSIYFDTYLPHCHFSTPQLSAILKTFIEVQQCNQPGKKFSDIEKLCSKASAYRWLRRFKEAMSIIRPHIDTTVTKDTKLSTNPVLKTWRHLEKAFCSSIFLLADFLEQTQLDPFHHHAAITPYFKTRLPSHFRQYRLTTGFKNLSHLFEKPHNPSASMRC